MIFYPKTVGRTKKQVLDHIKTMIKDCEMDLVISPDKLTDKLMQEHVDEMHRLGELPDKDLATEFQTDQLVNLANKLKK